MEPLLEYIEQLDAEHPDDYVTVVLPEFVPARWWHHLFHNQRALLIKGALLFKPNTDRHERAFSSGAVSLMDTRTRASIVIIRLAALVVMIASVAALWNFMLWLPWQVDCVARHRRRLRLRLQIRARGIAEHTRPSDRAFPRLVLSGDAAARRGAARAARPSRRRGGR